MSAHVERGQWPVLLSSPSGDGERVGAEAHARECPPCEVERGKAAAFLSVLTIPEVAPPSAQALARAKGAVLAELGPASPASVRAAFPWELGAAAAVFIGLVAMARVPSHDWRSLVVALILVIWGATTFSGRGTLSALLGASLAALLMSTGRLTFEIGHGLACGLSELTGALLPVGALFAVVRLRGLAATPANFAAAAIGGALVGQAALAVTCPSHSLGHLLVFHAAVVGVAGLMGAGVGRLAAAR